MRAVLLALLLVAATLSAGCLSDQSEPITSNNFPGCQEGQPDEEPEDCKVELPDENNTTTNGDDTINDNTTSSGGDVSNNTSNSTNSTDGSNQTQVPEEPNYGHLEGYQVHPLVANARVLGGAWQGWQLYDHFNNSWNGTPNGVENGSDSKWVLIEFLSTDCSHCWNAADDMSSFSNNYSNQLEIISIAVNFSSNDNFNASLDEVAAFQDKTSHSGCLGNNYDCSSRPGDAHDWLYVDGRNQSYMYSMQATGTPMFVIIMPNGTITWNQYQHNGDQGEDSESIVSALERLFGPMQ
ncbi:MAG TPA: hypothetical protein QF802_03220 [Candidatus Thalassarchaeaceae archaeon]|nr:hypothetical protein [Candidatus Thalassarchaeaceae archaeon]